MTTYFRRNPKQNVKNINKHAVLDLIRFMPGGISRAGIAKEIGLSRAAVTTIVNDLISAGIIRDAKQQAKTSGRPRTLLEIAPEAGYVAGIDMGATHLRVVVTNFGAHVVTEKEISFNIAQGPEACIAQADQILRESLAAKDISIQSLSAIGFGVPGPISSDAGMVIAPPIMPGWDRFPIRDTLEELWQQPVSVNNDAELGALGEWAYGAGRGAQDLAYIKVGTGIGAGLLIDGRIYRGSTGSAGEIGHLTMDNEGPRCTCGNRGCLEAFSGGHAIAQQAIDAIQNGQHTQISRIPLKDISAKDVASAAQRGDLVAQQIMEEAGQHLGVAIAGLVNIFNPDMIVVGGGVAQIGDLFLEPVRKTVEQRSLPAAATNVRITTALLGRRSSSLGAIVQALSIAVHNIAEGKDELRRQLVA
ncbi:MAG: ROK family transcriptional regulator [Anaerolineae bacterium]|mgnify:FL=1|nr:ROK family transcriptional regulator [Anaerolineae bacterium]MBT7072018.1 ROK family transcriptional regulator [Anaerolineae bacterium]MBT7324014.1 ROK family transcriptional regulator [Anaerolineae bacterium]